jgi:hypothetical protein
MRSSSSLGKAWAAAAAPWLAEPRKGVKYVELFPTEANAWATKKV